MSSRMRLSLSRPTRLPIWPSSASRTCLALSRSFHIDGRARLSNEWAPTGGIADSGAEDAHGKLIQAGFLRQSHSGIFQLLPLGLRVQDKIIGLVEKRMRGLGASRVQLSAISSEALWEQSGRLQNLGSELFRFQDRKEGKYLLGPTHEEEITTLVAKTVQSYKSLPLRLFQITQKYRDELRPRHGLLRGREFCMKDLYTFDLTTEAALETYEDVRKAYSELFINDMKLPILVAKASSGDMGGSLSHEYHIPTPLGEDHVMSCDSCDYVANEEVAKSREVEAPQTGDLESIKVWRGISKDRVKFINVYYDSAGEVNTHAVKKLVPDLDPGAGDAVPLWTAALTSAERGITMVTIFDRTVPLSTRKGIVSHRYSILPEELSEYQEKVKMPYAMNAKMPQDTSLLRITEGDGCPQCSNGKLTVQKAIELGHTFHLGTRYSEPMNAQVNVPKRLLLEAAAKGRSSSTSSTQTSSEPDAVEGAALPATTGSAPSALAEDCPSNLTTETFMQMGCHGIGISRIIGAVANHLVDERGLNWPRAIAPYEVVIVYDVKDEAVAPDASAVYDALASQPPQSAQQSQIDVVLDDREHARLSWKLQDGDLVGYPVIVVIGKAWKSSRRVEVQCRRLAFRTLVSVEELRSCVGSLLQKL